MSAAKMLHVDAIQTATPGKVTAPGQARRISAAPGALRPELLQSRFQAVLYYSKASEKESPLDVAAWMKVSLSAALPDHPVLAGRLRRDGEDGEGWEVKFNDSGVRLVQATAEVSMAELMNSGDVRDKESKLAYWEEVDMEMPNFSALFYIQVTQFEGDGYTIGISCSLLLADPLFLANFLKSWARTHAQMLAQGRLTESPIFHLSYFERRDHPHHIKSTKLESNPTDSSSPSSSTMLFKVNRNLDAQSYDAFATACLQETTERLGAKPVPNFYLMISDHATGLKIEPCADASPRSSSRALDVAWWDQFGLDELVFAGTNKPLHVSCQVVSRVDGCLAMVMIPEGQMECVVSVTLPKA
ncbi:hypothetical protein Cni_G14835 [Canna indica]|uniref:Uncharacterized protein n=1 Tax=Canna indica TaxID=4628 RepID=A0AAQ3QEC4_9LILI|nr:hypothetical protein Cni_G14835 [Canna indica]